MSPAQELEARTNLYWELSTFLHGPKNPKQVKKPPTVALAQAACNEILSCLGPQRPLRGKVLQIQYQIVMGGKRKKQEPRNNLIALRAQP